jgi:hypothetical protein
MKDKIIIWALGAAWGAGVGIAGYVMNLSDRILTLEANQKFIDKQISDCIKNDVFQVEKMLLMEKINRN